MTKSAYWDLHQFISLSVAAAVLFVSPAGATADEKTRPAAEFPDDIRVIQDLSHLGENRKEKSDLYLPLSVAIGTKLPSVILIHGGGFNDGDKARKREIEIGSFLARNGFAAFSINYKLWNKDARKPAWPQNLYDAKSAVRFLRTSATQYQLAPNRIAVFGCSAGGNLAAMLAMTGPEDGFDPPGDSEDVPCNVRCAIDFYGPVDLMNYHDMKAFLKTREEDPEVYRRASPIFYATKGDAPMLIVHGTADETVSFRQSQTLADALKTAGVDYEVLFIPDAPHTFALQPKQMDLRPVVLNFLRKHLTD